ncbi:MAG: GatB/YqeY domain-containing protein [Gammaproteobacteria bacterium]
MTNAALKTQILEAIKSAMKNQEKDRLGTLRLISAAIKQKEVDERIELDEQQVLDVLSKMLKQRQESINQYEQADRPELAAKEKQECDVIKTFMPTPLSEEELTKLIRQAIEETQASNMKDMGKVMAIIKSKAAGRADMGALSAKVKSLLNG